MYELKATDKHIRILIDALELYTRVGTGQVENLADTLNKLYPDNCSYHDDKKLLAEFKMKVFGYEMNSSMGICHDGVHDDVKISYDLLKVFQKAVATKENHSGMSVWHDGALLHLGSEPVAKIKDMESKNGQLTIDKDTKESVNKNF